MWAHRIAAFGIVVACLAPAATVAAAAPSDDPLGAAPSVEHVADLDHPTEISAGLWRTTLPPGASPSQFRYQRQWSGSAVHISVLAAGVFSDGFSVSSTVWTNSCGSESASASSSPAWAQLPIGVHLVVGGELDSACAGDDQKVDFAIERSSSADASTPLPLAIKVVEESKVISRRSLDALPAPPDSRPMLVPPTLGDAAKVEPGHGFDDAFLLGDETSPSDTVSASIKQGEVHYFAVDLDWGQSVQAALELPQLELAEDDVRSMPDVRLLVTDPMRVPVDASFDDTVADVVVSQEESVTATTGLGPVRFRERFSSGDAFLPGRHWLAVAVEGASDDESPLEMDYRLAVEVDRVGDSEVEEHPDYLEVPPFLIGDGQRSESASGNPLPSPADDSLFTRRRVGALVLGGFGLACLAAGIFRLRRVRRP